MGTGIFLIKYSHTASMLYLSWAEMGTTGESAAMVACNEGLSQRKNQSHMLSLPVWVVLVFKLTTLYGVTTVIRNEPRGAAQKHASQTQRVLD